MKYNVTISERAVRSMMGERKIRSILQLSELLGKTSGLGKNTIYDALDNGFQSKTLEALAKVFELETPEEVAKLLEVTLEECKEGSADGDQNRKHTQAPVEEILVPELAFA